MPVGYGVTVEVGVGAALAPSPATSRMRVNPIMGRGQLFIVLFAPRNL